MKKKSGMLIYHYNSKWRPPIGHRGCYIFWHAIVEGNSWLLEPSFQEICHQMNWSQKLKYGLKVPLCLLPTRSILHYYKCTTIMSCLCVCKVFFSHWFVPYVLLCYFVYQLCRFQTIRWSVVLIYDLWIYKHNPTTVTMCRYWNEFNHGTGCIKNVSLNVIWGFTELSNLSKQIAWGI